MKSAGTNKKNKEQSKEKKKEGVIDWSNEEKKEKNKQTKKERVRLFKIKKGKTKINRLNEGKRFNKFLKDQNGGEEYR